LLYCGIPQINDELAICSTRKPGWITQHAERWRTRDRSRQQ